MRFWSPRPKKDRAASNKIAEPMASVAETMSGGKALGKITRQMMRAWPAPMARSARTNSRFRYFMNSARVRRAVPVQLTTPMARVMVKSVGENSVTTTMANKSAGST